MSAHHETNDVERSAGIDPVSELLYKRLSTNY
jgi:hypothetical protein